MRSWPDDARKAARAARRLRVWVIVMMPWLSARDLPYSTGSTVARHRPVGARPAQR